MSDYLDYTKLEVAVGTDLPGNASPEVELAYSSAVSLKRIADALTGSGLAELLNSIASHPVNQYGEGFSEAIQMAIIRGNRGIES